MTTERISLNVESHESVCLVSLSNSGTQVIELGEFLTIGRDSNNDLELADPYVSTRHARIEKRSGLYVIRDQRSQNGTYINDIKIMEAFLHYGDRIRLGQREFLFQKINPPCPEPDCSLSSKNPRWSQQLNSLPLFARTDLPVLLLGSSGTGKEVLARQTHQHSQRSNGPFICVNCSALTETLIESELFGHVKGSFTGATHDRKGAFETARGGTLFLDEIGDLPLTLQPKLLRALENREIRPVGSDKTVATQVRIVAATHKNLERLVARGLFRADLFYRLHVIKVTIPDLKDRMEDFETILYGFAREMRVRFSHTAIDSLKQHTWPGNIRELRNVVARTSALFPQVYIQPEHIQQILDIPIIEEQTNAETPFNSREAVREFEKDMIVKSLIQNHGNQRKAAMELGLPKSTLHDRIKTFNIDIDTLLRGHAF